MTNAFHEKKLHGLSWGATGDGNRHQKRTGGETKKHDQTTLLRPYWPIFRGLGQAALPAQRVDGDTLISDDVHKSVDRRPNLVPRLVRRIPASLARAGIIGSVGHVKSTAPQRQALLAHAITGPACRYHVARRQPGLL